MFIFAAIKLSHVSRDAIRVLKLSVWGNDEAVVNEKENDYFFSPITEWSCFSLESQSFILI